MVHLLKVTRKNFKFLLILAATFDEGGTAPAPAVVKVFAGATGEHFWANVMSAWAVGKQVGHPNFLINPNQTDGLSRGMPQPQVLDFLQA